MISVKTFEVDDNNDDIEKTRNLNMSVSNPSEPTYNTPMYNQTPSEPTYNAPMYNQTPSEPIYNAPMYNQTPSEPIYNAPMYEPTPSEPAYNTPMYEPTPSEPTYIPPIYNPDSGQLPPFRPPLGPCPVCPPENITGFANIRFIYAATNKPPLNVYINGNVVVRSIRYSNITPYYAIPAGYKSISVRSTSFPYAIQASLNLSLKNGEAFTVAIINNGNSISLYAIPDTECFRNNGYSCMRVVNLSENSPISNIFVTNNGLAFRNVGFKDVTNYSRFSPGNYTVYATDLQTNTFPILNQIQVSIITGIFRPWFTTNINLQRNTTYTLYIIGNAYGFPSPQGILAELDLEY